MTHDKKVLLRINVESWRRIQGKTICTLTRWREDKINIKFTNSIKCWDNLSSTINVNNKNYRTTQTWSLHNNSTFSSVIAESEDFSFSALSPLPFPVCDPVSDPWPKTFSYTCSITFLTCIMSLADNLSLKIEMSSRCLLFLYQAELHEIIDNNSVTLSNIYKNNKSVKAISKFIIT